MTVKRKDGSASLGCVLVAGGCGFLGHHIVQKLVETRNTTSIIILDINTSINRVDGCEYVNGTITSFDDVTEILQKHEPQVVFHTVSPNPVVENRTRFYEVNSSLLTIVIRLTSLFGEGDQLATKDLVGSGQKNLVFGLGRNRFDFTYVGNNAYAQVLGAQALIRASSSERPTPVDSSVVGEAFVVTNDEPWPFWELTRVLAVTAGYKVDRSKTRRIPKAFLLIMAGIWEWISTARLHGICPSKVSDSPPSRMT